MLRVAMGMMALVAALVTAPAWADGARFEEGKHYQTLSRALEVDDPDKIEVREFFFYGCPACYSVEPYVDAWQERAGNDIKLVRSPILFIRGAEPLARAFYTAEALGVLDEIHTPLFDGIHKHRDQRLFLEDGLREFFGKYGVSAADFDQVFGSVGVTAQMRAADTVARDSGLRGVPAFTVNGKYMVLRTNLRNDTETFQVIDYLVNRERQARQRQGG